MQKEVGPLTTFTYGKSIAKLRATKAGPIVPRKRKRKRFRFRFSVKSRSTGPIIPTNEYENIFVFVFVLLVQSFK